MLSRLDIGADSFLRHLVIQDNLAGIAIQRHALPNTVFDGDDNLSATGETDRTLGCTTVRVELAYGMLFPVTERRSFPVHTASSDCTGCHIDEQLADLTISNHLANKALTTHMEHETVGACCWLIPVDT